MSKSHSNQKKLFKLISDKYDGKLNDEVAAVLGLSKSGAYSKMNGTNSLSYEEAVALCSHFDILLDKHIHNQDVNTFPFPFYSDAMRSKPENFVDYLKNILKHISRVQGLTSLETSYLANEIPIFHVIQFPYLCAFKFFVWNKINWHIPSGFDQSIIENLVTNKELYNYRKELTKHYNSVDGIEIWNLQMFSQTYSQIEYFMDIGKLTDFELIDNILFDMHKSIEHLKNICENQVKITFGEKSSSAKCKVYLNELSVSNEAIFISSDQGDAVYFHFDAPNYTRTTDEKITKHMKGYLADLELVSSPISDPLLVKQRSAFFQKLEKIHIANSTRIKGSFEIV